MDIHGAIPRVDSRVVRPVLLALLLLVPACIQTPSNDSAPGARTVAWEPWSEAAFARARSEHRLVLLDLHAVWCHWCHVMDETTYRDPEVARLLAEHFVCLGVDQDARPDLANRYEDYGWPATIVFDAQGRELALRSGYIAPAEMRAMLAAFVADPTPGPSARERGSTAPDSGARRGATGIDAELARELERTLDERYDGERGGFGRGHKYIDPASLEWLIARALQGDAVAERRARQTLDAALALIDPVWGGIYQYSTGGVWTEPHFEKIVSYQADDLRVFSLAYAAWKDERHLKAARDLERFLTEFLRSPDGAYYTSMDADRVPGEHAGEYFALDDSARRALGLPRVDTHVYARENGWVIRGLCALHSATGGPGPLERALRAAHWVLEHRALATGADELGFRHDEQDAAGPYLGDTLAMEQAFLALHEATGDRVWLERARAASAFVATRFALDDGFATAAADGALLAPAPQRDENAALARVEAALLRYTGDTRHAARAERALRWLARPAVARKGLPGPVLLAASELANTPLHVTIVGAKDDREAAELHRAALALPAVARRIDWLDAAEGPLANPDTNFPPLDHAAAFACSNGRCSTPAHSPAELLQRVRSMSARR